MKRNGCIDIIKFVVSIYIVMYHFNIYTETPEFFRGGLYGVEIFCIISGAFFYNKIKKAENSLTTARYFGDRFARFFPYTFLAFLLIYIYSLITGRQRTFLEVVDLTTTYLPEILLFGMGGMNNGNAFLNSPTWTISCMIIVETVVCGLLICHKKTFLNLILPISLLIFGGIDIHSGGASNRTWIGITNIGVLRVWCAQMIGIVSVIIADYFRKSKIRREILSCVEILFYLLCFIIMYYKNSFYWKLLIIMLCMIAVAITLSGKSNFSFSGVYTLTQYLGRLSFSIYLNHSLILKIFLRNLGANKMFDMWWLFLIVLFIFAIIFDYITCVILIKLKQCKPILVKIFTVS